MKTIPLRLIAAATLGLLSSCAYQTAARSAIAEDSVFSSGIRREVERCRAEAGRPALARHEGLDRLALVHSEYLKRHRNELDLESQSGLHMGSYGRSLAARRIYDFSYVNEFVVVSEAHAGDAKSPLSVDESEVVKLTNDSSGDGMVVCGKEWTHLGVGVVTDNDGAVFTTQIFATKNPFQDSIRTRFGP